MPILMTDAKLNSKIRELVNRRKENMISKTITIPLVRPNPDLSTRNANLTQTDKCQLVTSISTLRPLKTPKLKRKKN